jgi:2-dehydropantoate 2-reductase
LALFENIVSGGRNVKILVVGAGAVGGYFGGRLLEKGEDVTFLVRERRKQQLEKHGLVIESIHGNATLQPKTILSGEEEGPFDVILLSTKAYHLDGAIESVVPYVGKETMILPLLNGILHIDRLIDRFGDEKVLGGLCFIETTLDANGKVIQTSPRHDLIFGERNGKVTERIKRLEETFSGTKATFRLSDNIIRDMWHKYLFITTFSGITTLMRAPIGPIREASDGQTLIFQLFKEVASVMRHIGAPIDPDIEEKQMQTMNEMLYEMKSSMQRDMEKGWPVEADHLQGYLYNIAKKDNIHTPILRAVYTNLKVYEQSLHT